LRVSPDRRGQGNREAHGPRRHRVVSWRLPLVLFCILAVSSCGLEEDVTYYSPPEFAYAGNIITLRHNSGNDDVSFLGYDIYYRAFFSEAEADTARSTIESATNSTSSTPESVLSMLTSNGFKKVYLAAESNVTPMPLLEEGPKTFYFSLSNDSKSTNWYYSTNQNSAHIEIARGTGNGESFNEPYSVGDIDYGSSKGNVDSGDTVYIDAFAIAYGYDLTTLVSTYSFPASLYQPIGGSNGYQLPK
jgi:hypothetical protein